MEGWVDQFALAGVLWTVQQQDRAATHDRLEDAVRLSRMSPLAAVSEEGANHLRLGDADDVTAEGKPDREDAAVAAAQPRVELREARLPHRGLQQHRPLRPGREARPGGRLRGYRQRHQRFPRALTVGLVGSVPGS